MHLSKCFADVGFDLSQILYDFSCSCKQYLKVSLIQRNNHVSIITNQSQQVNLFLDDLRQDTKDSLMSDGVMENCA